eukprot:6636287-Alexandrium_andersonii.AAC.1
MPARLGGSTRLRAWVPACLRACACVRVCERVCEPACVHARHGLACMLWRGTRCRAGRVVRGLRG